MILDAWQRKVSRRGEYSKQRKPAKKAKAWRLEGKCKAQGPETVL